jgi:hypothetical protein
MGSNGLRLGLKQVIKDQAIADDFAPEYGHSYFS